MVFPAPPAAALSLDLWGTVIRSDPGFKPRRNEMLRSMFAPSTDETGFDHHLRQADRAADAFCVASGIDLGFEDRVLRTLAAMDVVRPSDDELAPMLAEANLRQADLAREFHPLPMDPSVPGLLADMRTVLPVVATSNTGMLDGSLMRDLLSRAGFSDSFDAHVFSNEVQGSEGIDKGCKPYRAIFLWAFTELLKLDGGLHVWQVLHMGDNYVADVCGADGFGMRGLLVNVGQAPTTAQVLDSIRKVDS